MHTTTERAALLATGGFALAAWFTGLAILAYALEPSPEVVAWAPHDRLATMLSAAPVSVLDGSRHGFLRLRGESPGFVRELYARGAWIVLPAGGGGCIPRRLTLPSWEGPI